MLGNPIKFANGVELSNFEFRSVGRIYEAKEAGDLKYLKYYSPLLFDRFSEETGIHEHVNRPTGMAMRFTYMRSIGFYFLNRPGELFGHSINSPELHHLMFECMEQKLASYGTPVIPNRYLEIL